MCYVDDVVIATPTLEDLACMKRAGLKSKPSKCGKIKDSINYLWRIVDKQGIRPDSDSVEAVLTWKSPKTDHQLMSFLGFANYHREFIKGYADKVNPMQLFISHKGKKFTWNNAAEESFQRIKKELCEAPVICMPTEKRNVRAGYGCVGGSDLWHTPSRAGREWEDSLETDSIREQSLEWYKDEVRGTQGRNVCDGHLCREIQGVSR